MLHMHAKERANAYWECKCKNISLYTSAFVASGLCSRRVLRRKEERKLLCLLTGDSHLQGRTHVWESEDELVSLKSADLQKPLCGAGRQSSSSELVTHRYN